MINNWQTIMHRIRKEGLGREIQFENHDCEMKLNYVKTFNSTI